MQRRGGDPDTRRADAMAAFRQRMQTDAAKAVLRQRALIAELPNAATAALRQFCISGIDKVRP